MGFGICFLGYVGLNVYFCHPFEKSKREVAQAGSAPGLGPGGRRFESCLPDKKQMGRPDLIGIFPTTWAVPIWSDLPEFVF